MKDISKEDIKETPAFTINEYGEIIRPNNQTIINNKEDKSTIEEMNQNGTADYYLELKKYINQFVNRKYPLTQDDMRAILDDKETDNVMKRKETSKILMESLQEILKDKTESNRIFSEGLENGTDVKPLTVQQQSKEIEKHKQQLLEKLWEHEHLNNTVVHNESLNNQKESREKILYKLQNKQPLTIQEDIDLDHNPLTDDELQGIIISDPEQLSQIKKFDDLREKAAQGRLSQKDLKFLCDTTFGEDSIYGQKVYDAMINAGRVKSDDINPNNLGENEEIQENTQSQTGQKLIDGVVEQSQKLSITADEISDANKEINQTEKEFTQPTSENVMTMGE